MDKWEYPKIQDLDNEAFILIRQKFYDILHELHFAENYKIVNPEKDYNVYWENVCELVEHLPIRIAESVNRQFVDSQSSTSSVQALEEKGKT